MGLMILVAGATGTVGLEICKRMRESGLPVRGLVRRSASPAKLEQLQSDGVQLAWGDLKDPATLRRALVDVDGVIAAATALYSRQEGDSIETVDRLGQLALIEGARSARVERFLLFGMHRNPARSSPLTRAKTEVEVALRRSGLAYTILSCNLVAETWLGPGMGLNPATRQVVYFGNGNVPVSWLTAGDAAAYAVEAMQTTDTLNRVFEVCGLEEVSQRAVVALFEWSLDAVFEARTVTEEALLARLEGNSDPFTETLTKLQLEIAHGLTCNHSTVQKGLQVRQTPMAAWVRRISQRAAAAAISLF